MVVRVRESQAGFLALSSGGSDGRGGEIRSVGDQSSLDMGLEKHRSFYHNSLPPHYPPFHPLSHRSTKATVSISISIHTPPEAHSNAHDHSPSWQILSQQKAVCSGSWRSSRHDSLGSFANLWLGFSSLSQSPVVDTIICGDALL